MDDIKKVLEALQNGEISAEEAEALINAIKSKEENKDFYQTTDTSEEPIVGEVTVIDETENFQGDLNIVNGEAIIKGKVAGDCSIVFGKLTFSGEIDGDLNVVGSRVNWNGGIIHGSLNIVACRESGRPPKVYGGLTRVNNLLLKGVFKIIKPFFSGMKMKEANGKKKKKYNTLIVEEGKSLKIEEDINAEEIIIKGKLVCNNIYTENMIVIGEVACGNLQVEELEVSGLLKCGNINAEKIIVNESGKISTGNVNAEEIILNGTLSAGFIGCETISGRGILNSGVINCEENNLE
ncbi:hypothetical protein XJ44_03185 [Thermosipho affectus]|uniref:YvlB/LiaX N-terminal domain-containing protein n=1 Tax=Thermosipho affectus TaxID=660294 RepID=A0ABX3II75_9BACT|nr:MULTISPECIES: hypothetical protein [Thermosipho]ANQ53519.1 hypothetical protein Y592_03255 [Thermosipho sp. 1070]APT71969.1 hypothetical protein BG95_03245 [Thermosipho sp. 1063]ONN27541.1 hypothetical protein XJ44_03185 [Thermosipho affectus]OOC44904.1 hypothetical protein XO08_03215 [Thermosipho sp. 1074]